MKVAEKAAPRKELQAFCPESTTTDTTNVRRRDRQTSANTKKMKPPTAGSAAGNNSFAKATASSQNRSKSPAFTPAIAPKKH